MATTTYTHWSDEDDALLRSAYKAWNGAGPLVLPPELLARHRLNNCQVRASRMGITRQARPRQPDVAFKLKPAEAAYLAGLIDGEGHVHPTQPLVQITTTTIEIIDWLTATIPIGRTQKPGITSTGKPIYRWLLSTRLGCSRLYRQVLPYLLIEEKRARMERFIL